MKPTLYNSKNLIMLLNREKVATLMEIKIAVGTNIDMTIFRKLKEVGYLSSYSHRGKYYTLDRIVCFDDQGLWSFNNIWFSKFRTLLSTVESFVSESDGGYFTREIDSIVHVSTKKTLWKLFREERIARELVAGLYLYLSADSVKRKQQIRTRRIEEKGLMLGHGLTIPQVSKDELKAAIIMFFSLLNERERRLYVGLESLKLGYGGDRRIGELLGVDFRTVAKGRQELLQRDVECERIRKSGGGRNPIKKHPK